MIKSVISTPTLSNNIQDQMMPLSNESGKKRLQKDIDRDAKTYRYLLYLSGITVDTEKKKNVITEIWGMKDNRNFVYRVVDFLCEEKGTLPALSLNRLVSILGAIEKYWKVEGKPMTTENSEIQSRIPKFLTNEDKLQAIQKYCSLSREELIELSLPSDLDTYVKKSIIERVMNEEYLRVNESDRIRVDDNTESINEEYIDRLIQGVIENEIKLDYKDKASKIYEIKEKVKNEIKSIELQSGLQAVKHMRPIVEKSRGRQFDKIFIKKWEASLPDQLIKNLTCVFVKNIIIEEEFPIYFKYIEVEKVGTLPLDIKDEHKNVGLLNRDVWNYNEKTTGNEINEGIDEFISALGERYAYRVRVHFCIKIDLRHQLLVKKYKKDMDKNFENELHFFEEVSGVSSIISLIRKALNRATLWDIPVLKKYFPVAQEVYVAPEGKLYGNDTLATVWATSRVRLVELEDVEQLLDLKNHESPQKIDFESFVNGSEISQGDYICFDMIEAITVSGFYARLNAVKQLGVNPNKYIEEISERVVAKRNLMKGVKRLWSYPFSLKVMESYLQKKILDRCPITEQNSNDNKDDQIPSWSNLAYEARLHIIQGYLEEGLTKKADKLINELELHVNHFNHLIAANYYLCKATSCFLSENKDREHSIRECEEFLEKASHELGKRCLKFFRVDEFSQANLSPSFSYWARIYALKARISVFFPFLNKEEVNNVTNPISLLEKARISAARDGNSTYYAKVTLYQSWCYLMHAYIGRSNNKGEFTPSNCLEWAKRLIDHALLCYSKSSKIAYQDYLKDVVVYSNEEDPNRAEDFGDIIVPPPPLLHPVFNKNLNDTAINQTSSEERVIDIDSLLINIPCKSTGKIVDLFGQHSSIYFFSYGMLMLCDECSDESKMLNKIKEANKFFIFCWAIGEGGGSIKINKDNGTNTIERNFEPLEFDNFGVSRIRGLYLHRISEIVDLAKIFALVCKSITHKFEPSQDISTSINSVICHLDKEVSEYIQNRRELALSKVHDDQLDYSEKQTDYNTHLHRQFYEIIKYLIEFEKSKFHSVKNCRDSILPNVFRRLRGDYSSRDKDSEAATKRHVEAERFTV